MEELVQALEISQIHVSLEKISTFLEKKDSDDLKQSSDKETTSHSKREAFDSTSNKRPSKYRKSEQCSSAKKKTEQCGSDDLEQSSDKETTSHSKRKAFDLTSKRPSKRRKFEQCNSATQKSRQRRRQSSVARLLTPLLMIF